MKPDTDSDLAAATMTRIDNAAAAAMRQVGGLETLSGALWPAQAGAIAVLVSSWAEGEAGQAAPAVAVFLAVGMVRALLVSRSRAIAFRAADAVVGAERRRLIEREARRTGPRQSSGAIAALLVEKVGLFLPYLTRYRPAMLRARVLPLFYVVLCVPVSWAAALILLVTGPLIPVFMALVGMAAREASERQMQRIGDLNSMLVDRVAAMTDLRLLDAAARSEQAFALQAEGLRERTMAVLRVAFLSSTVLELFSAIGVAMVAVYIGFSLLGEIGFGAWASPLTLAEGTFLLLLAPEFFQPLRDVAAAWHDRAAAQAVAGELAVLEDETVPTFLGDGGPAERLPGHATVRLKDAAVLRGPRQQALPDLRLDPGKVVVLSGPSGSGKSTCLAAVAGLLPLSAGTLRVAGQPLEARNADAWRARIAWVPQAVHFRDVSLREFLDPSGAGDIADALAKAHASEIVARLPGGLEAQLGETGAGVSGGEARRLLLARALLAKADLVLADEPTADLDTETAGKVIATLRVLAERGAAVLVASHDPAVIDAFERSVVLEAP